ncbi:hypothetical protein AWB81_08543 [Caballeronia arationis]|nr:hypothetical protein AWB81_08543 [Caballeronia arationis]
MPVVVLIVYGSTPVIEQAASRTEFTMLNPVEVMNPATRVQQTVIKSGELQNAIEFVPWRSQTEVQRGG